MPPSAWRIAQAFIPLLPLSFPMTISNPSFPPLSEPLDGLRSYLSRVDVKTTLQNFKSAAALGRDCPIWAIAIAVVAVERGRELLPHLATALRLLADAIDPDSAPLTPPMTARDIPDTLEFFTQRDRMVRPKPTVPPATELAVDADLQTMTNKELMAEYGTKSRRLNKEQLIFKITEARRA